MWCFILEWWYRGAVGSGSGGSDDPGDGEGDVGDLGSVVKVVVIAEAKVVVVAMAIVVVDGVVVLLLVVLLRTLGGDACHSAKAAVLSTAWGRGGGGGEGGTKERVPQKGALWPCFSPENIMVWVVFEQVLVSHWCCVPRTVIRLVNFELTVHMSILPVVF